VIKIHITIDGSEHAEVVAHIECGELEVRNVGLTLAEAKSILVSVQKALVAQQTSAWVAQHRQCRLFLPIPSKSSGPPRSAIRVAVQALPERTDSRRPDRKNALRAEVEGTDEVDVLPGIRRDVFDDFRRCMVAGCGFLLVDTR
jgi:hypothetical protein